MTLLILQLLVQPVAAPAIYQVVFEQLSEDIHVARRPDDVRLPVNGNITIIRNQSDVVVVDSGNSPTVARQVVEYIRSITDKPVAILINTHGHEDHVLGNQVFAEAYPGMEIISREETRNYMVEGPIVDRVNSFSQSLTGRREDGRAEMARLAGSDRDSDQVLQHVKRYYEEDLELIAKEYESVALTPPTATFTDHFVLHRAGRTIELLDLGPGKSGAATVVYLPEDKVVIAGDVVTRPIPYGFARDPAGWLRTLHSIRALEFVTLIPGHGPVESAASYLNDVIELVQFVLGEVEKGVANGLSVESLRQEIDLAPFRERLTSGDPLLGYRFQTWFEGPAIERAHRAFSAD